MEYTVIKMDPSTEDIVAEKNFVDVALYSGKKMLSEVGGAITTPNVRLYVTKENGEKQKEVLSTWQRLLIKHRVLSTTKSGARSKKR
jgi:hypothetical protein